MVVDEELEGLVELVVDVLGLAAFDDEVGDDGVDAKVQFLNGLLAIFGPEKKKYYKITTFTYSNYSIFRIK